MSVSYPIADNEELKTIGRDVPIADVRRTSPNRRSRPIPDVRLGGDKSSPATRELFRMARYAARRGPAQLHQVHEM
jgi:hypothetical protein